MADQDHVTVVQEGGSNALKWILLLLGLIYVAGSLYLLFDQRGRLENLSKQQTASQAQIGELTQRMQSAEARISKEQKEQYTQLGGEIGGVKTDVGGVKTDLGTTKTELEATKAKLESTIGDLGMQSGLIAKTRDDLEVLKHKGDRQYYEFTLMKGAKPQPVSTVSLQLKKVDAKRGKYTMNVTSDDKTIEKKDRNQNEPIQFYSGRDHMLYELVVWTVDKNKVTGYLSTPKNAPVPVTASPTASNQ